MIKMITRTLLAALWCAYAGALSPLAPLQAVGDTSECALYLNGPGRTSAYDYSINLLKGNFGYEGQANCITYEAINQAYLEARNRILVSQPKGDWKAEDFASVGELILDISISLARRYGLTYEEIEKGLPLIDTSRTLIREVCPPVFSHVECRAGKYRRFDGLCNNLEHPTWGAAMAPFQRLIGPLFSDGINSPRIAHHGKDLPLSRVVSRTMHPDEGFHDHAGTVMVIAWGQFMDHDYTLTGTPLDPVNRNDPEECCKRPLHLKHPYCNEIRIPDDDYFYRLFGVKCIDFVRGFPSPRPGCRLGSRVPFNTLTAVIDGNTVYGVTEKFARKLRTGFGGLLRMNPVFKEYGLKDLLPLKLDIPDEGCTRPNKNMYCFEAGEIRVNEQLVLTVMHTLMAREHNRVANALAEVNPHWDDETLFQEARRINIAEIQHITYNEFLPILLGKDVMQKFGLVLEKEGYWDGYDPEVNPDVIASFAAAAYRFGHSLLPTAVERWSKAHKFIASKRLSDLIRRPYDLYRAGVLDEYVMGLMNQVAQAMDDSITQEVTNHLFKKVGARFGMDLVSFNMQRGREFGLPGYMEFRKFCGLPHAETFQDLFGSMPNATVQKYETIFDHPIDVDLWSGGVSERPLPGSMLGPTFACIIATQFSYSRRGDRFWFELPNQPSSFTPEQLTEIRKARLARVICDNTDIIDTVQLYPMVLPDHELNPRVPCRSGVIPSMDFSKWAEPVPFRGAAKQFMTNATITENNSTSDDQINRSSCNQTDNGVHNCSVNTIQAEIKHCSNNTDCNSTIPTENNRENKTKANQVADKDTVLKYVYKKEDNADLNSKAKGHYKNSLKRRRRSVIELHNNSPLPSKFNKPVVVNYETSHGPRQLEPLLSVDNTGNTILGANLADFKIETVHANPNIKKDENTATNHHKVSTELENLNEFSNETNEKPKKSTLVSEESDEQESSKNFENSANYQELRKRNNNDEDINRYKDRNDKKTLSNNQNYASGELKPYKNTQPTHEIDSRSEQEYYENEPSSQKSPSKPGSNRYTKSSQESDISAESNYKNTQPREKDDVREHEAYKNNEHSRERDDSRERSDSRERNGSLEHKESHENDDSRESADIRKHKESRENDDIRERGESREHKESRESAEILKHKESRENDDSRERGDSREHKESRESADIRKHKESRENDDSRERGDSREHKGSRESADIRKHKESRENHDSRERGERREHKESRESADIPEHKESLENDDSHERGDSREHKESRESADIRKHKESRENDDSRERGDSRESDDSRKYIESRVNYDSRERDDSRERGSENNRNSPAVTSYSTESGDDTRRINPKNTFSKATSNERTESSENRKSYPKSADSKDSVETDDKDRKIDSKSSGINKNIEYIQNDKFNEATDRKDFDLKNKVNNNKNKYESSHETSDEKVIQERQQNYKTVPINHNNKSSPNNIQDIDLNEFSYEKIHINRNGKVEPQKESLEEVDPNTAVEILPLSTATPEVLTTIHQSYNSVVGENTSIKPENDNKLINIDDGEIKPVVEINSENDSGSNEENTKPDLNEQVESLETILGIKEPENLEDDDQNGKIVAQKEEQNRDVKQQFERIPLNYSHNEKNLKDNQTTETPKAENTGVTDGTLDVFIPEDFKYDENLNIKFDDLTIKLPEIKLPDDILAYTKDNSPYSDENEKQSDRKFPSYKPTYYYDNDEKEKAREVKRKNNDDDDEDEDDDDVDDDNDHNSDYYGYHEKKNKKQNYKKKSAEEESDEAEDLYEKFVRERFGKRGTFEKRSENLEAAQLNPELYKTVKQILKKTANIDEEAKKSGDPNAGYMWTLEYGDKL